MSAQRVTHNPRLINDAARPAPRLYLNLPTDTHKHNSRDIHARTMHTYVDMIAPPPTKKNLWSDCAGGHIQTILKHTQTLPDVHTCTREHSHVMHHASKHVQLRPQFHTHTHISKHHHVLMDGALVLSLDLTFSDSIIRNYSPLSPWPGQ